MKRATLAWVGLAALVTGGCSDGATADEGATGDPAAETAGRDALMGERSADAERSGVGDDLAAAGAREGNGDDGASADGPSGASEESDAQQSDGQQSDGQQSDTELIGQANGWTLEEAELYQAKTEAAGEVAGWLDAERGDVFIGSAVGPEPSDAPRVYIKGVADARVHEIAGAAEFEIRVIDRQPYSRQEISDRQSLLTNELIALGFDNFAVGTDIQREGLMEATAQRKLGAPNSADEVLAALPAPLRERTSIVLVDDPVYVFD
jgi:hypothetical protein